MSSSWPVGPDRPPPPSEEVHVWRVELDSEDPRAAELLPAEERECALRKRRPGSGARWAASRWALRTLLSRYLDEDPAAIGLAAGESGKPVLAADRGRLAFNLSHSGALALVAVAIGREVGVDVEAIDPGRDLTALAERSLDAEAAAAVRAAPPSRRPRVFYEAWVRHEAVAKCLGTGIWSPAAAAVAVDVSPLELGPGHAAALAVASDRPVARRCFSIGDPVPARGRASP